MKDAIHCRVGGSIYADLQKIAAAENQTLSMAARDLILEGLRERWRRKAGEAAQQLNRAAKADNQ